MEKIFLTFYVMFAAANSAFAVDIPDVMKQGMSQEIPGMPSVLNLVISMIVVIALIYITGWVYAKLNVVNRANLNKIASKQDSDSKFNIVQSMPLGQQRYLYSIEMNGKILLVGSTPSHINLIKEFNKEDVTSNVMTEEASVSDAIEEKSEKPSVPSVNFEEIYKKYKS